MGPGLRDLKTPGIAITNFELREGKGIIEGQVADSEGEQLRNVQLVARPDALIVSAGCSDLPENAASNARGEYRFTDLLTGNWNVTAYRSGYLRQTKSISLDANQPAHVDFELEHAFRIISVVAKNSMGQAVPASAFCPYEATTERDGVIQISIPESLDPFKCWF